MIEKKSGKIMTRARILSQALANIIAGGGGGSANITFASLQPFLTTANVIELTSLYFSNARVYANLQLASLNDLYDVNTTNKSNGQAFSSFDRALRVEPVKVSRFIMRGIQSMSTLLP